MSNSEKNNYKLNKEFIKEALRIISFNPSALTLSMPLYETSESHRQDDSCSKATEQLVEEMLKEVNKRPKYP
jgi:hypothetical protein